MNWIQALERAKASSEKHGCTVYVNAIVRPPMKAPYEPAIDHYVTSDWFVDGSTVARFDFGERREL